MDEHHEYCTGDFSPDDIVISGIAGRFPQCRNIAELKEALLNQKFLLFETNERYEKGAEELPMGSAGTIKDVDKFDREYFSYSSKSAECIEPTQRQILEVSYEAIADSGYDPSVELKGANIGVYTAISNEDAKEIVVNEGVRHLSYALGFLRTMAANRCSHHFDFRGPSYTMDSACSSSFVALASAFCDIRDGRVDAALVNAGQLCLSPVMTCMYQAGGIASSTFTSKPFDIEANGIFRTEGITAFFLQKASVARRAYATIMHVKNASAGFAPEGICVPSFTEEVKLFNDVLRSAKLSPNDIQFVEAHGTGTKVGDPVEVRALEAAYCQGRDKPLYIGSVKGNVGHGEANAGQTGAIKAILAFETGLIAPNYKFGTPNPNCEALLKGSIKIVTETMPLTSPYIPVNSFGFGGSIVQAILKRNSIEYSSHPESESIPRLMLYPATTEAAVHYMFDYVKNHPELRSEFFALLNKLSFPSTLLKPFRGYALFQDETPVIHVKNSLREKNREVWFVMTGMGCQWPGMGLEMMKIKIFADSMMKSAAVLKSMGIDLFELLKKDGNSLLRNRSITSAFVAIASIQIALVDVLRALEIHPDGMLGHSTGELICAYADGCCTAEQTILSAYWRGKSVESAGLEVGAMAAIGLTWEEAVRRCPKGVYPACHNAEDSVTISGLKELVERFVSELQQENIFARVVDAYGYAFHCEQIWPAAEQLRNRLLTVITEPQPRSKRWISTSYPENEWHNEGCRFAGPEYFVHNLMSMVRFNDALKKIPSDALTIEIGPHFLLQSILKRSIGSDACYIGLMKRNDDNNIGFFLESLGKLYVEGLNPKIEKLYRPVKFPVPRSTPLISDLIQWDHSQSYFVPKSKRTTAAYIHRFEVDTSDSYLLDHFIDGRSLFPATGYVYLAWLALGKKLQKNFEDLNVIIKDFKIHRPLLLSPKPFSFNITILDSSGHFEILEGNSLVSSGKVYVEDKVVFCEPPPTISKDSSKFVSGDDIYNELRIQGYEYGPAFQRLVEASFNGREGFVEWKDNWITFMDALLLFFLFTKEGHSFLLPTGALSFKICPKVLKDSAEKCQKEGQLGLPVNFHADSKICRTVGLEIRSLDVDAASKHIKPDFCIFEEYKFVPYVHKFTDSVKKRDLEQYLTACNKVVDLLQTNLNVDLSSGKFCVKCKIDFDVDTYAHDASDDQRLLLALKEMVHCKTANDVLKESKSIFSRFVKGIGKDVANTILANDYCLRFMFDIISENSHRKLSILEINNNSALVLPSIVEGVEKFSMLKFKSKTLVCKGAQDIDKGRINECNILLSSYEALTMVAQERSQGVVISVVSISSTEKARKHLSLLSSVVEQRGFILLFHKNKILPPENLVASLCGEAIEIVPETVLESWFREEDLAIISKISNDIAGNLYLLRHLSTSESRKIIKMSENSEWLNELKSSISNGTETLWVLSEVCPSSGVIGMVNCLRHEPGGDRIRCVFIPERDREANAPPSFSFQDRFFEDVLEKDLLMNVYKDGCWGSFRHIRMEKEHKNVLVEHSYLNMKKYGDLSSLYWAESALNYMDIPDKTFVHVYYSALNFRDIMLATGKLSTETATASLSESDNCVLGLEYSGRNKLGTRIAGICSSRGIATATEAIPSMCVCVPDNWSLEEAATVPVVYATCYYALIIRAGLQHGDSILIHSGTGGIGLAAINIALSMNCEIYTTVGTEKKRQYLLNKFPSIKNENIGCSRDTTFENMIMKRTAGKGVNVVLNSLADDKFHASVRCVASHGRFVEIGKYDIAMDNKIGLKFFLKNIAFHAILLDQVIADGLTSVQTRIQQLLSEGIRTGVVKPLDRTVFQRDDAEKAFRYMGTGTHIGKVLLKIRDEEKDKFFSPQKLRLPAVPVTYFYPHKVYIVVGGLGGFGIEISKWLLQKGARNLILTTRYGARTPYHHFCLNRWKDESYNVITSTRNVSIKEDALKLLREAAEIGPVGGIFNSAVVLHDAFLENTTLESFKEVCAPKADATRNLDSLSRCLCPELDNFVCFSSISCGRGNAGQMNYGYANSVMERICEQRRADGLPGLAIQWGIIGEVGVVHRHMGDDAMIAGVCAQRVKSCLEILDVSCQLKRPVVCSYVVKDSSSKAGDRGDVLQQLARILGLKDASEFNAMRSFAEMGIDSMIGVEVKQLLETSFDTTFSVKEIQELKVEDIKALLEKTESAKKNASTVLMSTTKVKLPMSSFHSNAVERLNDVADGVPVFIIDTDSSDLSQLRTLSKAISQPVFALLLSKETPATDVESLASWYLKKITEITKKEAHIVAHLSASVLAFEIVLQTQKSGKNPFTLTILDGSSSLLKIASKDATSSEVDLLCEFVENYIPSSRIRLREQLSNAKSFEQQIKTIVDLFIKSSTQTVNRTELTEIIIFNIRKLQLLEKYQPQEKLSRDMLIIEDSSKLLANDVAEVKMLLSEICSGKVTIRRVPNLCNFSEESVQKIKSELNFF